jgi:hypothetical protein
MEPMVVEIGPCLRTAKVKRQERDGKCSPLNEVLAITSGTSGGKQIVLLAQVQDEQLPFCEPSPLSPASKRHRYHSCQL